MKRRLVVVGNGMAGARLVEDVLARDGGARHQITVFGDEPCGNYNRILLSSVLARSHDPKAIFINPLPWYAANGVTLHAGVRVESVDVRARQAVGADGTIERYDTLVIATGSRAASRSFLRSTGCRLSLRPRGGGSETRVPAFGSNAASSSSARWTTATASSRS